MKETGLTNTRCGLAAAIAVMLWIAPALAHHAFSAEFDANKPVHLEGVVTKVEFINPHAWIHIDVTGRDGKVSSWMIEAGRCRIRYMFDSNWFGARKQSWAKKCASSRASASASSEN